jgi:hypothetical protein
MIANNRYDPEARAAEKQASRDADEAAVASSAKSREELRRENGAFALLRVRPDFAAAHAGADGATVSVGERRDRAARAPR